MGSGGNEGMMECWDCMRYGFAQLCSACHSHCVTLLCVCHSCLNFLARVSVSSTDGCGRPFHVRCAINICDVDNDEENWFCGAPGCRGSGGGEGGRGGRGAARPGDKEYVEKRAQRYKGVSWDKWKQRWRVQGCANGNTIALGDFDDENDGARAYNVWAKKCGKPLDVIGDGDEGVRADGGPSRRLKRKEYLKKRAARYKGVSWAKDIRKWKVFGYANGKTINLGSFDDENDGARAYNVWAKKCGKPLNVIGDGDEAIRAEDPRRGKAGRAPKIAPPPQRRMAGGARGSGGSGGRRSAPEEKVEPPYVIVDGDVIVISDSEDKDEDEDDEVGLCKLNVVKPG